MDKEILGCAEFYSTEDRPDLADPLLSVSVRIVILQIAIRKRVILLVDPRMVEGNSYEHCRETTCF